MFCIVVQKDFLDDLKSIDDGHLLFRGFELFINRVKQVDIITDLSEASLQQELNSNPFWQILTQNIKSIRFDFLFTPASINELAKNCSPFCFFLIKSDFNHIVIKHGFPYLNTDNFERWSLYDSSYSPKRWRVSKKDGDYKISSWDKLSDVKHDFHSLLLIDPYALSKEINLQEKDWISLVLTLQKGNECDDTSLFILPREDAIQNGKSGRARDDAINTIKGRLSSLIAQYKRERLKSTVILLPKDKRINGQKTHDRYVITNTFYIEIGAGFDAVSSGTQTAVECRFVFYPEIMEDVQERVELLSSYINKIEHSKGGDHLEASKFWIGEKKSRIIQ